MSPQSAQRLVHELEVHQIELEMQNEELRASQAKLEAALSDYAELYDFAPASYFTLARGSQIRQANLTAASLLGIERSRLLNRRFTSLVAAESRPVFGALLTQAFETKTSQSGEVRLLIEGKLPLTVHLQASVMGSDPECLVVLTELTAALRQSAAIVEASNDAIISMDLDGTILTWNPAAEAIFGYRAEEVIGQNIALLVPENCQADQVAILEKVRKGGRVRHYEAVRLKKDGTRLTVSLTISPVRDASGNVVGASKIARDITERKQTEEKLRESEAVARARADELATLLAATPAITFIAYDRDCRHMTSSHAALHLMRLPEGANTSKSAPPGECPETFRALKDGRELRPEELPIQRAAATGQAVRNAELTLAFDDGTVRTIVGNAVPLFDAQGKVRGALGTFLDITEREQLAEVLRLTNAYNRSLIEASLDALVTIGPDGRITDVNAATETLTGRTRKALIGTDFSNYFTDPEKARAGYQQVFREGSVRNYPLELRHRDGHTTSVHYNASGYRDETGKVIGIFAAARDITERKRAEKRVRMFSQEIIAAREQERKQVSSVLHHDVGSLAVGIAAHFDAIEGDLRSGKPREALKWMKRTRKLFDAAVVRLKKLAIELRPPELDVLGLHAALRQYFSQVTERGGTRIHFRGTLGRRRVSGDTATILFRVAQEALTNAITHGHATRVDVGLSASKKEVGLTIRDNGKGFNPSEHRARAASRMGLRVMHEMAASAGGTFTIDSGRGKRTTVRVRLPMADCGLRIGRNSAIINPYSAIA